MDNPTITFRTLENDNYRTYQHVCKLNDIRMYEYYDPNKKLERFVVVFKYTDLSYYIDKKEYLELRKIFKLYGN